VYRVVHRLRGRYTLRIREPFEVPSRKSGQIRTAKAGVAATRASAAQPPSKETEPDHLMATRELFWNNVVRELLMSLSVMWAQKSESDPREGDDIFDGRIAVITSQGNRVAIGAVYPLFACALADTHADRTLSTEVECTVFQIETPEGEAYTLPLHEVRGFHSLSAALMERIKDAASELGQRNEQDEMPFGFAAFTSLARSRREEQSAPAPPTITGPGLPDAS
jgi:hypothetical protein